LWDNVGGVDTRRPRHITLPIQRETGVNASSDPSLLQSAAGVVPAAVVSDVGGTDYLHIAAGDAIYTLNTGRDTLTRRVLMNPGGRTWSQVRRLLEFTAADGTRKLYAFGFGPGQNNRFYRSANGTTWTEGDRFLYDAIVWDGLLIVQGLDSNEEAIFGSANGDDGDWDVDDVSIGVHWRPGGGVRFIGVAMAPWGASAVYFLDQGRLWVLDWYVHNAIEIEDISNSIQLTDGIMWNGSIYVTDGWNVYEYNTSSSQTVRRIGVFGKDGMPPSWSASDKNYVIVELLAGIDDLIAVCLAKGSTSAETYRLLVYNGVGWSWLGPEVGTTFAPMAAIVDYFPISFAITAGPTRYIDVLVIDRGTRATELHPYRLPKQGSTPTVGIDGFEDGPLHFETGWFDGGFVDIEGALLRITIDGHNLSASETVKVEYVLNNDEDMSYKTLGTFTQDQQEIWFDAKHQGIAFTTVRFRITLDRGSTITKSPELKALILLFDKIPLVRVSVTATIDVSRIVERGMLINEETATTESVWQFLKSLGNTPELINLVVPSLESGGINVRITGSPAGITDNRPAMGGRGKIQLTMVEPAGY